MGTYNEDTLQYHKTTPPTHYTVQDAVRHNASIELDEKAKVAMNLHKFTYEEAVHAVLKGDPGLRARYAGVPAEDTIEE